MFKIKLLWVYKPHLFFRTTQCLSTRVKMNVINEYTDPEVEIKGQRVVISPVKRDRRIQSFLIKFFHSLLTVVVCGFNGCRVTHYKYGLHVDSNQPCVFHEHSADDKIYYIPYRNKCSLPFKEPQENEVLITGIRWLTPKIASKEVLVDNSCLIDSFLSDLKLRSLDKGFCFECMFLHKDGPGRLLERCLRTLIMHIITYAKPIHRSGFQRIRKFSYEEDVKIKRIWIDQDSLWLVPEYDSVSRSHYQDLKYRPKEGGKQIHFFSEMLFNSKFDVLILNIILMLFRCK